MPDKRLLSIVVAILFLDIVVCSTRFVSNFKSKEQGWITQSVADQSDSINVIFALKQSNLELLEKKFWSVSDPYSTEYRDYLSLEKIAEIIAPKDDIIERVINWISSYAHQVSKYWINLLLFLLTLYL